MELKSMKNGAIVIVVHTTKRRNNNARELRLPFLQGGKNEKAESISKNNGLGYGY
jgi:hypothetical protein